MLNKIYLEKSYCWAPRMDAKAWKDWAEGFRKIPYCQDNPPIDFLPAKSLRRMNQMTRMTLGALHAMLPLDEETPLYFVSTFGEAGLQLELEREYHLEKEIHPATFSNSVYNAPLGNATILLGQHNPYSCLFPRRGDGKSALMTAIAPLVSGRKEEVILIVCEEALPPAYAAIDPGGENEPFVYALKLTRTQGERELDEDFFSAFSSLDDVLRILIRKGWA